MTVRPVTQPGVMSAPTVLAADLEAKPIGVVSGEEGERCEFSSDIPLSSPLTVYPRAALPQGNETTKGEVFAGMMATPLPSMSGSGPVKTVEVGLRDESIKTGGEVGHSSFVFMGGNKSASSKALSGLLEVALKVPEEPAKPTEGKESGDAVELSAAEVPAGSQSLAREPEAKEVQIMTGEVLVPAGRVLSERARLREAEQMGFIVSSALEIAEALSTYPEKPLTKTDDALVRLGYARGPLSFFRRLR